MPRDELVDPRRVVTATCRTTSADSSAASCPQREPCPREMIPSILEAIYQMSVSVPVRQGDVLETVRGVEIVATRSIDS